MNYTSVEQSKKLLELGISPETADLKFKYDHNEHHCIEIPMMVIVPNWDDEYNKDIPCWSVGALLEIMPIIIRKDKRHYYTLHIIGHRKVIYAKNRCVFHKEIARPLIDACYNMVVWLLENNFIRKRE